MLVRRRDISAHPDVIERLGTGLTSLGAPTYVHARLVCVMRPMTVCVMSMSACAPCI